MSLPGARNSSIIPAWVPVAACVALAAAPLAATLGLAAGTAGGAKGFLIAAAKAVAAPSTLGALRYGLWQSFLSTLLALALGLPGAWLVARHDFPGKRLLRALAAVPFCVPPILVILAFVLYFGRGGFLNFALMGLLGLEEPPITFLFSLAGLVLVHGFYNFPIVLETVGAAWMILPRDREEAARTLGAGPLRAIRTGILPSLLPAIIQAASLVFLFCFFSFVVVLVFGPLGGSTLEVEIYRASRIDGDIVTAAALALIETCIAILVVLLIQAQGARVQSDMSKAGAVGTEKGRHSSLARPKGRALVGLIAYAAFLAIFFAGPLLGLVAQAFMVRRGMSGAWRLGLDNFARLVSGWDSALPRAVFDTLLVSVPAAVCATLAGAGVALTLRKKRGSRIVEAALTLPLAVSGVVTALGWTLMAPTGGRLLVAIVLGLSALPFTLRSVSASLAALEDSPAEAARTLGASRLKTARDIILPSIAPALLSAAAFSFSMAAGDATVPLLLGQGDFEPLPLLIYRLVGAYRFPEACAAGLVLASLTGVAFFLKD